MADGHTERLTPVPLRSKPRHAAQAEIRYLRSARRLSIRMSVGSLSLGGVWQEAAHTIQGDLTHLVVSSTNLSCGRTCRTRRVPEGQASKRSGSVSRGARAPAHVPAVP